MTKRIFIILILIFTNLFVFAQEEKVVYYKAVDNYINIRTEPNTKSSKQGQLFYNDVIKVYPEKSTEGWFYCYIPKINNYGYCCAEYFEKYWTSFYEIVDKILEGDSFYIEMVENGAVQICVTNLIFNSHFTKLTQYPEEKVFELLKFALKYDCIYDTTELGNVLTECVIRNYLHIVEYLLTETDSIKQINKMYSDYYGTPMFYAVIYNYPEMLELLLKYGADPNKPALDHRKMFRWIDSQVEENEYTEEDGKVLKDILLKNGYVDD